MTTTSIAPADVVVERERRQRDAVAGYRILGGYGWGDDGSGHISARDPEHTDSFWLPRYGVAFSAATTDDLVLVGPDGALRVGEGPINDAAFFIHRPIHRARPDVVGVVHTHTGYGTPFAALCTTLAAMSQKRARSTTTRPCTSGRTSTSSTSTAVVVSPSRWGRTDSSSSPTTDC